MKNKERPESKRLTCEEANAALAGPNSFLCEQADLITGVKFQQAINCCGLTSVAYALTALGCPTTVDDLFMQVGVNVESAVGDGMTLAEIYDASLRYVFRAKLPVFVECYHFDSFGVTAEGFREACIDEAKSGIDDILIFNFHSGIAHGMKSGGGGHFSVLTGLKEDTDEIIMADVHGVKYGSYWSTPLTQIFEAMVDKDSCGRSRGAMRFGRTDKNLSKPVKGLTPTLIDWTTPPAPYKMSSLKRYIPAYWDDCLGVKNMEGASALGSAMRVLEGDNAPAARLDEIMRGLKESYTFHLDNFLKAPKIKEMAMKLHEKEMTSAEASCKEMKSFTADSLRKALGEAGCGEEGLVIMATYDMNVAIDNLLLPKETGEAGALSHGARSWGLIADFNPEAADDDVEGVLVVPGHSVLLAGRMWSTSLSRMAAGMGAVSDESCALVVLDRRSK